MNPELTLLVAKPDTIGSFTDAADAWILSTSDEREPEGALVLVSGICCTIVDPLATKSVVTKQRLNSENLAVRAMSDRATILRLFVVKMFAII